MNYGRSPLYMALPLIREFDEVMETIRRARMDKPMTATELLYRHKHRKRHPIEIKIAEWERLMAKELPKIMADEIKWKWKQEPLTADEIPTNWAWEKWPAEYATSIQELNNWFKKGTNQMLQVKGTDEYRVPTEDDVVFKNQIIGSDPDPQVRASLLKEAQAGDGDSG